MVAIGIDPGVALTGFGLLREEANGQITVLAHGVIETPKTQPLARRLQSLQQQLQALVATWQPQEAAVEEVFFATNAKTALSVGQARGVVLLTLCNAGIAIHEYTPLQVKQAIAGYGQADKRQMQTMIKALLGLAELPRPDDAADALAVALTHLHSRRWAQLSA
ncbi:MAG: crossover junction endodeoxyribonuclease RuvC [Chloroflexi bacterium]|nr:crossover junction endodeoxyribonuclease RuvC [Chloroflexota bacterium]